LPTLTLPATPGHAAEPFDVEVGLIVRSSRRGRYILSMKHATATAVIVSLSTVLLSTAGTARAAGFYEFTGSGGAIADGTGANMPSFTDFVYNEVVSGALFGVNNSLTLDITHTWVGDLTITLEHAGVTVTLLDRLGVPEGTSGNGANLNGVYTFSATGMSWDPYEEAASNAGVDIPEGEYELNNSDGSSLSDFAGLDVNGAWTLTVSDSFNFDTGAINSWTFTSVPAPSAAALFGLASVAATRRRR